MLFVAVVVDPSPAEFADPRFAVGQSIVAAVVTRTTARPALADFQSVPVADRREVWFVAVDQSVVVEWPEPVLHVPLLPPRYRLES